MVVGSASVPVSFEASLMASETSGRVLPPGPPSVTSSQTTPGAPPDSFDWNATSCLDRRVLLGPKARVWLNGDMQFGISTFVTDEGIAPGALARAIEERGFDSLFVAEHTHIPLSRRSPYPAGGELPSKYYRTLDPFITLTAAAVATERLLLGTGVALMIERDPIVTAKEVASLDLVSAGRAIFGVGVDWNREEMENHGTDPYTRGRLLDERIRAMVEI